MYIKAPKITKIWNFLSFRVLRHPRKDRNYKKMKNLNIFYEKISKNFISSLSPN